MDGYREGEGESEEVDSERRGRFSKSECGTVEEASSGKKGQSQLSLEREVIRRETVGYMSFSHYLSAVMGALNFAFMMSHSSY